MPDMRYMSNDGYKTALTFTRRGSQIVMFFVLASRDIAKLYFLIKVHLRVPQPSHQTIPEFQLPLLKPQHLVKQQHLNYKKSFYIT